MHASAMTTLLVKETRDCHVGRKSCAKVNASLLAVFCQLLSNEMIEMSFAEHDEIVQALSF